MFFSVVLLVSALTVIISVLFQESSEGGMGSLAGQSANSLWGSNRGQSKEAILQRITIVSATIFIIATLVLASL